MTDDQPERGRRKVLSVLGVLFGILVGANPISGIATAVKARVSAVTTTTTTTTGEETTTTTDDEDDKTTTTTTKDTVEPPSGNVLELINSTASTFDPIAATDTASGTVIQNVFDALLNYQGKGDPEGIEKNVEVRRSLIEMETEEVVREKTVEFQLELGEEVEKSFTWEDVAPGEYLVETCVEDHCTEETLVVPEPDPAFFAVEIDGPYEISVGSDLPVTATVENVGDLPDTQNVVLTVGGTQRDVREDVQLSADESDTFTLEWDTAEGDAGEHMVTVASDDDSDSTKVEVG